jgi:hypothetical protein
MDGTRDHHVKQNRPDSKRQVSHAFSYMWTLRKRILEGKRVIIREKERERQEGKEGISVDNGRGNMIKNVICMYKMS